MERRRLLSSSASRLRAPEPAKPRDKAAEYHRVRQRVVVFTTHTWIEGTVFYPENVRLSDALNSPVNQHQRYVPLTDVVVRDARDGSEICRAGVLMVHHRHIVAIIPRDELKGCSVFQPEGCQSQGNG